MPKSMGSPQDTEWKNLNARVSRELWERLRQTAVDDQRSLSFVVAELLEEALRAR